MYFHPLQEEIGNLSDEDISKRIKELFSSASSFKSIGDFILPEIIVVLLPSPP